ncbi:PREDICTED: protein max isoform X3 [Chinchilla lanigera]|uniref:protein max isoform X3 n=1 Tax=Chinchilla lanigera TaxID=34839 RepID=UPI000696A4D3|nr:PREDICTED: protein max isoform X3 [Chinchilla lanigera]
MLSQNLSLASPILTSFSAVVRPSDPVGPGTARPFLLCRCTADWHRSSCSGLHLGFRGRVLASQPSLRGWVSWQSDGRVCWPPVRALEKARSSAQLQTNYPSSDSSLYTNSKGSAISAFDGGSDSSSESEPEEPQSRKKLRMEAS